MLPSRPAAQAAWSVRRRPCARRWSIARLNAGISAGFRLVTRLPSTTTSSSTHSAPALRRSVLSDGHAAMRRPRATPASMTIHGPWQIAATGLSASKKAFTNSTAFGCMRSESGFITPPGSRSASKSFACAVQGYVDAHLAPPLAVMPAVDLLILGRHHAGDGARRVERGARLLQLGLLEAIRAEDGDPDLLEAVHRAPPLGSMMPWDERSNTDATQCLRAVSRPSRIPGGAPAQGFGQQEDPTGKKQTTVTLCTDHHGLWGFRTTLTQPSFLSRNMR